MNRQLTAEAIIDRLLELVPEFAASLSETLFKGNDGSFTTHGVFSAFSSLFREHFGELTEETRQEVFNFVEECVRTARISEDVSNAACTCFLENIAGDEQLADVAKYLGPESREFFNRWNLKNENQRSLKKAVEAASVPIPKERRYRGAGKVVKCSHCGGESFVWGSMFVQMVGGVALQCVKCSHLQCFWEN